MSDPEEGVDQVEEVRLEERPERKAPAEPDQEEGAHERRHRASPGPGLLLVVVIVAALGRVFAGLGGAAVEGDADRDAPLLDRTATGRVMGRGWVARQRTLNIKEALAGRRRSGGRLRSRILRDASAFAKGPLVRRRAPTSETVPYVDLLLPPAHPRP